MIESRPCTSENVPFTHTVSVHASTWGCQSTVATLNGQRETMSNRPRISNPAERRRGRSVGAGLDDDEGRLAHRAGDEVAPRGERRARRGGRRTRKPEIHEPAPRVHPRVAALAG